MGKGMGGEEGRERNEGKMGRRREEGRKGEDLGK